MGADATIAPVVQVLGRVPLFSGLSRSDLERIAELGRPRELQEGEFLFREGDEGGRCHIVESGAVEVLKERPLGQHRRLAVKRAGGVVGELSLVDDAPCAASVRALEPSRLLVLERADFHHLLGGDSLAVRLLQGLGRRQRGSDGELAGADAGAGSLQHFNHVVLHGLQPRSTPAVDGYTLAGASVRNGAWDSFWDAYTTDDGRTLMALMDVKGSGLPPAYLIAVTRALFRELGPQVPFDDLLRRLNTATFSSLMDGMDECVELALVEIRDGVARWSCAGDQPATILAADGSSRTVAGHGPPLGIIPHFDYGVTRVAMAPGDTLLAFSDAPAALVTGAMDLVRSRAGSGPAELAHLLQVALENVQAPGPGVDISFLLARRGNAGRLRG